MARTKELINHITEFINIYTLILGAILVILGVQFIFAGIALGSPDIVIISLIFIVSGAALVSVMLKDKIYQKVFYTPAYPPQYPRTRYPYNQYTQAPQYQSQRTQYIDQAPIHNLQQKEMHSPQTHGPSQQAPAFTTEHHLPDDLIQQREHLVQGGYEQSRIEDHSKEFRSTPFVPEDIESVPKSGQNEDSQSDHDEYQEYSSDPNIAHPDPIVRDHPDSRNIANEQYQSSSTPSPIPTYYQQNLDYSQYNQNYASPQGSQGYHPPYYSTNQQPYETPYLGVPYYTYVQYFRETLSIPQIRSLLKVFIIAMILGSIILILGEPFIFLFPIFFIIAFSFPSFIWISYVYNKDVLEPESKHAIFLTLAWGMFSTLFVLFPNVITEYYYGFIVAAVIVAPLNEEFFKPLGIRKVTNEINSELDGLIYGVTCGMGFAIIENFMYELGFLFNDESPIVVWTLGSFIRGIGSTIIHAVGAGLIGFTYARKRIEKMYGKPKRSLKCSLLYNLPMPVAFLIAVAIHAAWNGSAAILSVYGSNYGIIILAIAGHVTVFLLAFHIIKCLANEGFRRDMERHGGETYTNPQIYQYS